LANAVTGTAGVAQTLLSVLRMLATAGASRR